MLEFKLESLRIVPNHAFDIVAVHPMIGAHIICPHCHSAQKPTKFVPDNSEVTCSQCRQKFRRSPSNDVHSSATRIADSTLTDAKPSLWRAGLVLVGLAVIVALSGLVVYRLWSPPSPYGEPPNPSAKPDDASGPDVDLPQRPAIKKSRPPLIALNDDEERAVKELQSKGIAWLKTTQRANGSWEGNLSAHSSLAALTLLEYGVPATDPALQTAAAFLRQADLSGLPDQGYQHVTYNLATALLFLTRLNDTQDRDLIRQLTMRLIAGQTYTGGWGYSCPTVSPQACASLEAFLTEMGTQKLQDFKRAHPQRWDELPERLRKATILNPLPAKMQPKDKGPKSPYTVWSSDNSNTQFALLALWNARKLKLPVDAALQRVVLRFRKSQTPKGSWKYDESRDNASLRNLPSMTCAGLLGLAVGYGIDPNARRPDWKQDEAIRRALKHVSQSIGTPNTNVRSRVDMTEMYFLWSLERVGVLFQLAKIENKDWYRWGLGILRPNQRPDGSWYGGVGHGSSPLVDTCLALLFLNRSNLADDLTDKLEDAIAGLSTVPTATPSPQPATKP